MSLSFLHAKSPAKAILIGEHGVVYGYPAIALPLQHLVLEVRMSLITDRDCDDQWQDMLSHAFQKALGLFAVSEREKQKFFRSCFSLQAPFPIGGGLGASAALSVCLVRLAAQVAGVALTPETVLEKACLLEQLFHGKKSSGLDVHAVLSSGLLMYQKEYQPKILINKQNFWLALVDSGRPKSTQRMVDLVSERHKSQRTEMERVLKSLGDTTQTVARHLELGDIQSIGPLLSEAHRLLNQLGVGYDEAEDLCQRLKKAGALGAKITGAGGGGLVLGLFDHEPINLHEYFGDQQIFTNPVLASEAGF